MPGRDAFTSAPKADGAWQPFLTAAIFSVSPAVCFFRNASAVVKPGACVACADAHSAESSLVVSRAKRRCGALGSRFPSMTDLRAFAGEGEACPLPTLYFSPVVQHLVGIRLHSRSCCDRVIHGGNFSSERCSLGPLLVQTSGAAATSARETSMRRSASTPNLMHEAPASFEDLMYSLRITDSASDVTKGNEAEGRGKRLSPWQAYHDWLALNPESDRVERRAKIECLIRVRL